MEITALLASARPEPLVGASVAASPDTAATQQFAALMRAPAAGEVAAAPPVMAAGATAPAAAVPAATGLHSVGDRILQGMQNVSTEMRSAWDQVSDMLSPGKPMLNIQEMLGLQLHMVQASMQFELVGKAVSRSSQNFDQLVRVQ